MKKDNERTKDKERNLGAMKKRLLVICVMMVSIGLLIGCGKKDVMKTYVEANQDAIDAMAEAVKDMMEIEVKGEGNTLTYTYKLLIDMGDIETTKGAMESQMEMQKAPMEVVLKELADAGVKDPVIILEYLNRDGELITSHEFK